MFTHVNRPPRRRRLLARACPPACDTPQRATSETDGCDLVFRRARHRIADADHDRVDEQIRLLKSGVHLRVCTVPVSAPAALPRQRLKIRTDLRQDAEQVCVLRRDVQRICGTKLVVRRPPGDRAGIELVERAPVTSSGETAATRLPASARPDRLQRALVPIVKLSRDEQRRPWMVDRGHGHCRPAGRGGRNSCRERHRRAHALHSRVPRARRSRNRCPPMARATSQRMRQSGLESPTGRTAARTRWMRRSAFMNVPSFSNEEQAGRNTVPNSRAVSVRNRSWTMTRSSERKRAGRLAACWVREQHIVADRPECLQPAVNRRIHHRELMQAVRAGSDLPAASKASRPSFERHRAGQCARVAAHVRGALDIVLAPERVDAGARNADVAGQQREIDQRLDALRALDVFGQAEAVHAHARAVNRRRRVARRAGCLRHRRRRWPRRVRPAMPR